MAQLKNLIVNGVAKVVNKVIAPTFVGDLTGTATKATQDSAGQQINTTYIKGLSVSGTTITYTKGNGTTGTITTQDTNTNTTYSAGTGLSLSGTTFNHSNSVTASTAGTSSATSGSTLAVPYVTYDAQGHVTASGTHTHTITGFNNYSHPTGDGNLHVPATSTTNNGKFLMAGSTAGSLSWGTPTNTITAIASTTGSGNAVTAITASSGQLTVTKGTTFLTAHQDISGKANLSGATFTGNVTVGGTSINASNGHITTSTGLEIY